MLKICGVSNEDVVEDYAVSEVYLHDLLAHFAEHNPSLPEWMGRSKPEYMAKCLELLEEKHGSFDAYLDSIGVGPELIEAIRRKLIQV